MFSPQYLNNLWLFVQIVDAGGISAAARSCGMTRSRISRRLIDLENELGAKLLHRDARHFAITPVGIAAYRHAVDMCDAASAVNDAVKTTQSIGQGALRIGLSNAMTPWLAPLLASYAEQHKQLHITTHTSCAPEVLIQQQTDVVFQLGQTLPDSTNITARQIGSMRLVMVTAPSLFMQLGAPQVPRAIPIDWRLSYTGDGLGNQWRLAEDRSDKYVPRMASDQSRTIVEAVKMGIGLAQLPFSACREAIDKGELEIVMEAYEPEPMPVYAMTLSGTSYTKTIRDFVDYVRMQLANPGAASEQTAPEDDASDQYDDPSS